MNARTSALEAMRSQAEKLNLYGVSVVLVSHENQKYQEPMVDIVDRFIDEASMTKDWSSTGANYWAIVMSKIAEMLETRKESGSNKRPARSGEFGYKGGISSKLGSLEIFIAFSGGTEEQDLQVTKCGVIAYHEAFHNKYQDYKTAFLQDDQVLLVLPPEGNSEEDLIKCVVINGDSTSEGHLFNAEAYTLRAIQANSERNIGHEAIFQNIEQERIIPLL